MKKTLFAISFVLLVLAFTSVASAQTATGTLTVTATVNGSINLVFNSDASGVALASGAGTNTATLAFGNISAYGPVAGGVTQTVGGTNFTVSTPVDVYVTKVNSASANYNLAAQLGSADATNTWKVAGTAISTGITGVGANLAYATNNPQAIAITVPFTTANSTAISNTIIFTASAN